MSTLKNKTEKKRNIVVPNLPIFKIRQKKKKHCCSQSSNLQNKTEKKRNIVVPNLLKVAV